MHATIYTHISWWIYRTLKTDQSFSTPKSLHFSSPLSTLSFLILWSNCICRRGGEVGLCVHCAHIPSVHLCCANVCKPSVSLCIQVKYMQHMCMYTAACARRLSRHRVLFHVHYHLFYSGIFKLGSLGTAVAIVREQRKALRVSGGCGMRSTELFSKCCTPHFMESQWAWPEQPCMQTELNSPHSCINGSLCAIPPQ